jgi:hypothetical protein
VAPKTVTTVAAALAVGLPGWAGDLDFGF